ncbi:MAG: RNA methyltransferase [Bacteroidales bacterium]|nr:RNA methyltransferase [Bacteroidales bacterium]MBR3413274.1 RNA methyltransferase [Bacteroidales bacterium]
MGRKLSMEELHRISVQEFKEAEKMPLTVVLDNVRSQNNIGSVFRTGDAFRVERICLCGICSTPPHRDIHKTALGAEDSVEWTYYEETADCVRELKAQGYKVYAIEQVDDSIKLDNLSALNSQFSILNSRFAIVFGNEVEGVQEELLPLCDGSIEIPQQGTKHSLNVSCAAAIVMWELFKELRGKK